MAGVFRHEHGERLTDDFVTLIPDILAAAGWQHDRAMVINSDDAIRRGLCHNAVTFLAFAQRVFNWLRASSSE